MKKKPVIDLKPPEERVKRRMWIQWWEVDEDAPEPEHIGYPAGGAELWCSGHRFVTINDLGHSERQAQVTALVEAENYDAAKRVIEANHRVVQWVSMLDVTHDARMPLPVGWIPS